MDLCTIVRDTLKVTHAGGSDDKKEEEGIGNAGNAAGELQPESQGEREERLAGREVGDVPHSVHHPVIMMMMINLDIREATFHDN